jgi:hypothetical protein
VGPIGLHPPLYQFKKKVKKIVSTYFTLLFSYVLQMTGPVIRPYITKRPKTQLVFEMPNTFFLAQTMQNIQQKHTYHMEPSEPHKTLDKDYKLGFDMT